MSNLILVSGERVEVLSALVNKEVAEVTVELNWLLRVINLHSRVVDELLLFWMELCREKGIIVGFHGRYENFAIVVVTDRGRFEHWF